MPSPREMSDLIRSRALMSDLPDEDRSPEAVEIAELVQRTVAGDSAAFRQIVLRYERRVLTLSKRLLSRAEDAQEAMQEVFLRAYRFMHRVDPKRPIEPWLIRMTVNVCRDLAQTRGKRDRTFYEIRESDLARSDGSGDPYSAAVDAERRTALWEALDQLPSTERTVIILRDLEGYSTAEVAAILKSSESTVRGQISRGRLRIRKALERTGHGL